MAYTHIANNGLYSYHNIISKALTCTDKVVKYVIDNNMQMNKNVITVAVFVLLIFAAAGIITASLEKSLISSIAVAQNETDIQMNETAIYSNKTSPAPENSR
jgi:hypothetical protein